MIKLFGQAVNAEVVVEFVGKANRRNKLILL
jgi:hypothetical protein